MSLMPRQPLPRPTEISQGFWDAAARGELVVQGCDDCGQLRHYPQPRCPSCVSPAWSWRPLSGRGAVHSFSIAHRAFNEAWADRVPYAVVTVELDEGVRMVSDLPDDDLDDVAIGRAVEVFFDRHGDVTLPRFRLARPLRDAIGGASTNPAGDEE